MARKATLQDGSDSGQPFPATSLLAGALPFIAFAALNPFGWDQAGPLRWFAMPVLGFALITIGLNRLQWGGSVATKAWVVFLVWGGLSSTLGADKLHAWIGTPDRRFGWITWLLCCGLFLVARQFGDRERAAMVRGVAAGATIMAAYTLAEVAGWIDGIDGSERAGGTFGQPAYLGAASVLALPICVGHALDRTAVPRWRWIASIGAVGTAFTLLASQSRAAWLGAAVAALLWFVVRFRRRKDSGPAGTGALVAAGAAAALLGLILVVGPLRRRVTSAFGDGGVIQGRIDEWEVGLRAIGSSPVFGYGPEGYRTVFGQHVDEQYAIDWGRDVITDRAHNGVLDTALAFGVPGALLMAVVLAALLLCATQTAGGIDPIRAGLAVGVVGYVVQQQFLFPLSEVDPVFWLAAGLLLSPAAGIEHDHPGRQTVGRAALARSVATGLAGGLSIVVAVAGLLDLMADRVVDNGIDKRDLSSSIALRQDSTRYRFIASRVARQGAALDQALQRVDEGLRLSPKDPAFRTERASILLERARETTEEPLRANRLAAARAELERLVADDPNHPDHLRDLGIARALVGDLIGATAALQNALVLAPERPDLVANLDEVERLQLGSS